MNVEVRAGLILEIFQNLVKSARMIRIRALVTPGTNDAFLVSTKRTQTSLLAGVVKGSDILLVGKGLFPVP
jgi:hypothetical protein